MPIIDPDGYFGGDRFDDVSDQARAMWPSFFLASNTVGRIELNYLKVTARAFSRWKRVITDKQFWDMVTEYNKAFLLYVYRAPTGQLWGQWDTSEKFLTRYKLAADLRSPAPTAKEFLEWKSLYLRLKAGKSNAPSVFGKLSDIRETFPTNVCGVGVGVGVGEKENPPSEDKRKSPAPPQDGSASSRASRFSLTEMPADWELWASQDMRWDGSRIRGVFDNFSDHWKAKAGGDARKVDWMATWRIWCRNEEKRYPSQNAGRPVQALLGPTERAIQEGHRRISERGKL